MDLSTFSSLNAINGVNRLGSLDVLNNIGSTNKVTGVLSETGEETKGTLFEAFLNTAIDNIGTTNSYLSDAENEEIKFALGETENTHDLTIALQKASTALQYTVAVRDKVLEAYRELMQMQI
jgi:flagellar hook-basal body complex protein FliE